MSELDKLRQERNALNARIRKLQRGIPVEVGYAKLDQKHYPGNHPDEWYVAVLTTSGPYKKPAWRTLAQGTCRAEVISKIPSIIADLQKLYDKQKGGSK